MFPGYKRHYFKGSWRSLKCSKQEHDIIRFVFRAHSGCTFGVFILFLSLSLDCKNQGSAIYW